MAGDLDGMRTQIKLCLESADEEKLRRLNPKQLLAFVLLIQETGEAINRSALLRQATELLPGYMKKQVPAGLLVP